MKSNIIMQSNNGKHREKTISTVLFDARTLILTLVITMTMVMGTAFFTSTAQAVSGSGATVRVATFDQLNDALGNGGVSDIIIDPQAAEEFADNEDAEISFDGSDVFYIPIEYPLVVSHDVKISSEVAVNFARSGNGGSGKYDSRTFRGQNEVTPALFNVDQGKTLELSGDIAMTGEEVSATFDSAEGSFLFTVKSRDNLGDDDEDDNEAWSYGSDPGKLSTGGYYIYTKGGNVVMNDGILLMGLNTKDNVKDIAPVYIDGTAKAASLTVEGAKIVDNNLGQTEDGNSTAGAVILKGSNTTAVLNSGEIGNNNADVAGIIVKEEAELELGSDFGINDSDIYDEKAEEAVEEEAAEEEATEEEATEETVEEAKEEVAEEAAQEETKEEVAEEAAKEETAEAVAKEETAQEESAEESKEKAAEETKEEAAEKKTEETQERTAEETKEETPKEAPVVAPKKSLKSFKAPATQMRSGGNVTPTTDNTAKVATYAQLKAAVAAEGIRFIYIEKSAAGNTVNIEVNGSSSTTFYLPVDAPLSVTRDIDIIANDNVIITRSDAFAPKDGAIFEVSGAGNLNLSGTAENKKLIMSGEQVKYKYTVPPVVMGAAGLSLGGNVFQLEMVTNGKTFELNKDGLLVNGSDYLAGNSGGLRLTDSNGKTAANVTDEVEPRDPKTGTKITMLLPNQKYVLYSTYHANTGGYVRKQDNGTKFVFTADKNQATIFTATAGSGGSGSATKMEFTVSNPVWKDDQVGKTGQYSGYFANVTSGKLTINDYVTLTGLVTENNVQKLAPVYVGSTTSNATLEMKGGSIESNTVGYVGRNNEGWSDKSVVQYNQDGYAGVRGYIKSQTPFTNTAGGVIFDGNKAIGTLSGGEIKNNQADAGGIIVMNGANVTMDGDAKINNNIGFHHAGAAQVEGGGTLIMNDGEMSGNVAWHRGGAVWATEFGTTGYVSNKNDPNRNPNGGGNFIMKGGLIDNNFAFVRGGGINVESNGVVLEGGTISNNKCKSLGGGIYVEGDTANYSYTLVIEKGDIRGNTAVRGANGDLDQKLDGNTLKKGTTYGGYGGGHHNDDDFPNGHAGNGGGVWLCPLGGTSVFATNGTDARVVIDENNADGSGDDFYLTRGKGSALIQNLEGTWKYDNGGSVGTIGADGKVLTGPVGMYADYDGPQNTGIKIHNNLSRDGGGIAANGTVILGKTQEVYRFDAELELEKEWDQALLDAKKDEPVTLELKYTNPYNNDELVTLSRTVATESNGTEVKDYTIVIDENTASGGEEGDVIFRNGAWKAKALISPVIYHEDNPNQPVELYRILKGDGSDENSYYDLKTTSGVQELYNDTNNSDDDTNRFKVKWMNLVVSETANGINRTYNVEKTKTPEATVTCVTKPGSGSIQIHYSTITVGQTLKNSLRDTSFTLTKAKLGAPNTKLQGAEFKLYKAELGNAIFVKGSRTSPKNDTDEEIAARAPYKTLTSDANGVITFNNVEPGPYLLFETKVAPGYELPKSPWFIYVDEAGNPTVVRMNDNRQGQLTNDNYHPYDPSDLNNWVQNKWWDKAWFRVTGNTLGNNSDTNVEISSSVGDGIILIKDGEAENESGVLSNKLFELYKFNEDKNQPLDGVVFIMHGATVNTAKTKLAKGNKVGDDTYRVTSQSGTGMFDISSLVKKGISEKKGTDPSKNIPALAGKRVFLLYEDQAKSGYVKAKMPWLVILDGTNETAGTNEILEIREYKDKYSNDTEWDYADFNKVIWKYNGSSNLRTSSEGDKMLTNRKGSLEFIKVKPGGTAITGQQVKFKLHNIQSDKTPSKLLENEVLNTGHHVEKKDLVSEKSTTSADGKVTFNNVDVNKFYLLFEDTEPTGYKKSDNPWLVYLKDDGSYRVWKFTGSGSVDGGNTHWDTTYYTEQTTDNNKLQNEVKVELTKVGPGGEDFNGTATFELYEVQPDKPYKNTGKITYCYEDGYKVAEGITTNNGVLDLTPYMKDAINDSRYNPYPFNGDKYFVLKETATSNSKYKVQSAPWLVIVKDGAVEVKVYDDVDASALTVTYNGTTWYHWEKLKFKTNNLTQAGKLENNYKTFKLYKTNEQGSTPLGGAEFALYDVGYHQNGYLYSTNNDYVTKNGAPYKVISDATDGSIDLTEGIELAIAQNKGKDSSLNNAAVSEYTSGKRVLMLYETTRPNGYKRAKAPWLLFIDDTTRDVTVRQYDDRYADYTKLNNDGNKYWQASKFVERIITDGKLRNKPVELEITKIDASRSTTGNDFTIEGVKFNIYHAVKKTIYKNGKFDHNEYHVDPDRPNKVNTEDIVTNRLGKFTLPITETGLYLLYEVDPAEGYGKPVAPWGIILNEDGELEAYTIKDTEQILKKYVTRYKEATGDKLIHLDCDDLDKLVEYKIENNPQLIKVDRKTEQPLAGAKFDLYKVRVDSYSNYFVQGDKLNSSYLVSDENGRIDLSDTDKVPMEGNYSYFFLWEKVAPVGYEDTKPTLPWLLIRDNRTWKFTVREISSYYSQYYSEGSSTYNSIMAGTTGMCEAWFSTYEQEYVFNSTNKVILHKKDSITMEGLKGVKFDVYRGKVTNTEISINTNYETNGLIASQVSGDNGTIVLKNLPTSGLQGGKLNLLFVETETIDGYMKPTAPFLVQLVYRNGEYKLDRVYHCKAMHKYSSNYKGPWAYSDYDEGNTSGDLYNSKVYDLPNAGGMGTYWFMIIGAMMMGFALTAGFTKLDLLSMFRR